MDNLEIDNMGLWDQIVEQHSAAILNAALRVTGNLADAEDIGQEVFAEAFLRFGETIGSGDGGLLRRMAICRAIDRIRARKPAFCLPAEIPDTKGGSPVAIASSRETEHRLRMALVELPTREAEVFCLVYFEQLSNSEAAESLGISKTAVAKSLSMARKKIQANFSRMNGSSQ